MASSRCLSQDHPYSKVESNGSFTQAHLQNINAPASCTTTSLSLYVISYQRSLSVMRESQQQTQLLGSVVLLHLKCSYLVLSLKASAKVQQFSEPPKLFRSFFLKNYRNRLQ